VTLLFRLTLLHHLLMRRADGETGDGHIRRSVASADFTVSLRLFPSSRASASASAAGVTRRRGGSVSMVPRVRQTVACTPY
jgi:hypothetical protein